MVVGLVFLVFLFLCSYIESFNISWEPDRIIGGAPADIRDVPYQLGMEDINGQYGCGASIIHELWAISAAHCVDTVDASYLYIRSGSSYMLTGGTLHSVQKTILHPYYNRYTQDYDVSILKVSNPFYYSDVSRAILMASETPSPGTPAVVSGWGSSRLGGALSFQLQQVTVDIMDNWACKQRYTTPITPNMVCAAVPYGGKDACAGDSGGPLVANGKLVGVVSWGEECGDPYYPGVYTDVAKIQSWVTSTIQEN